MGHMISDESFDELHRFALSIGLRRKWFRLEMKYPRYDLTSRGKIKYALAMGAKTCTSKELLRKLEFVMRRDKCVQECVESCQRT